MPRRLVLRVEWFDDRFAGVLVDHGTAEPDELASQFAPGSAAAAVTVLRWPGASIGGNGQVPGRLDSQGLPPRKRRKEQS